MAEITEDRSCTLVGRFMRDWALAESGLDGVIATALKMGILESWLISTTIPVSHKWNIAKTLIDLSRMSDEDKTSFKGLEHTINELNGDRNMVAHCMFLPAPDREAVRFLQIASRGKLLILKKGKGQSIFDWSENEFEDRAQKMLGLRDEFITLSSRLKDLQSLPPLTLLEALSDTRFNPFTGSVDVLKKDS